MEKQRADFAAKFRGRFLVGLRGGIIGIILIFQAFPQTSPQIPQKFTAQKNAGVANFYTGTDIEFTVILPETNAAEITVIEGHEPQENTPESAYSLRAIKKNGEAQKSARISVWYRFDRPGTYILPALQIRKKNDFQSIAFEPVFVQENPMEKLPRIVVEFPDGTRIFSDDAALLRAPAVSASAGKPLFLKVYAQYASSLQNFEWEIPKNAVFSQVRDYTNGGFSDKIGMDLLPLADFEWISLAEGVQKMGRMKITAAAHDSTISDVIFPEFSVRFVPDSARARTDEQENQFFEEAFSAMSQEISGDSREIAITDDDCRTLARLYRRESRSIFLRGKKSAERKRFEQSLGITPWMSRRFFFGDFGISLGCPALSIPEDGATEVFYIEKGSAVEIKERAGRWIFVTFGAGEGWCKKDEVILWTWEKF